MNTDVLGTCVAQAEIGPTLYSTPYYNRVGLGVMGVCGFAVVQTSSGSVAKSCGIKRLCGSSERSECVEEVHT